MIEILSSIDSIFTSLATIALVISGYLTRKMYQKEKQQNKENNEAQ
jgi:ribosomal protein S17E